MTIRDFTMVSPKIWHSNRYKSLSEQSRLLFLYLLTNPHVTSIGCYRLPAGYACTDLQWEPTVLRSKLDELKSHGMIIEDPETETIWIDQWNQFSPLKGEKSIKGAQKKLDALPASDAKEACEKAYFHLVKPPKDSAWIALWRDTEDNGNGDEESQIPPHLEAKHLNKDNQQ